MPTIPPPPPHARDQSASERLNDLLAEYAIAASTKAGRAISVEIRSKYNIAKLVGPGLLHLITVLVDEREIFNAWRPTAESAYRAAVVKFLDWAKTENTDAQAELVEALARTVDATSGESPANANGGKS